jgi:hypothetical protein
MSSGLTASKISFTCGSEMTSFLIISVNLILPSM